MGERLIAATIDRPKKVLFLLVLATIAMTAGMSRLTADTDVTHDLPKKLPARAMYERISEMFPAKEVIVVGIESDRLFTVDGVAALDRLTKRIERLKGVYGVMSPTNARIIRADEDGLDIREAADPHPKNRADLEKYMGMLASQPQLEDLLVSRDRKAAGMLVFIKAGVRDSDVAGEIIALADDQSRNEGFALYVTGRAAATYWSRLLMGRDMSVLSGAALVVVIALLGLSFRSFRGVLLPLAVVVASVLWTLGLMGYLGIPITHSTEILPILLIAIGVADGVHLMKGYYYRSARSTDKRAIVRDTFLDLARPVVLTSVTTAVGFMALNTSGIESIMILGLMTSFGVMVALGFTLTMIPSVLVLLELPSPSSEKGRGATFSVLDGLAVSYGHALVEHRRLVAGFIGVVVAAAVVGSSMVVAEMSNLSNFPKDHPLRVATEKVNSWFGGMTNLVVVVETGKKDGIKDPDVLAKMDKLESFLKSNPHVGSVQSLVPLIKQMNKALHGGRAEEYRLPKKVEKEKGTDVVLEEGVEKEKEVTFEVPGRELVAQYLALYEMGGKPGGLANMVDFDFSAAKINVLLDTDKATEIGRLSESVRSFIKENFGGLKAELTGMAELIRAVNDMVIEGQSMSIATSLLLVLVLTAFMFRSFYLGVFSTLPLFFSLFLNFGVMGLTGIALNVMTMATSSVAVGVGIDYAIHYVHRYLDERRHGVPWEESVVESMRKSGVAIVLNAVTVAAGFSALVFSQFKGVAQMGFLIALTMLTSSFAALTVLPVLFVYLKPRCLSGGAGAPAKEVER
ncbi:MAG: RND family transporter [Deltaproteobacteria bacterium]|nr:RND family transporter [Deltaproteobacteria bacterium]